MNANATPKLYSLELPTLQYSECFAEHLARCLILPLVITLSGEIGTGKTTLIRALLRALGIQGAIKSPTYSLLESYELPHQKANWPNPAYCHHFDLYRIRDESELEFIGFRDYFQSNALCCIEWPEQMSPTPYQVDIAFTLTALERGRLLKIQAHQRAISLLDECVHNFKVENRGKI